MDLGWLPLTLNVDYLERVTDHIPAHNIRHMAISHRLGHVLESHLNHPERVAITKPLVHKWKAAGVQTVWAWSHELSGLPDELLPASPEHIDWAKTEPFLQDKYQRYFALMPEVDGIMLKVNETQVNLMRGIDTSIAQANLEQLITIVHRICQTHDKRLALFSYCDRHDELAMIGNIIKRLPTDIIIVNKHVPHDFHVVHPHNALIELSSGHQQWIEFDLGLQFEMQNAAPVADVDRLLADMQHAHQHGATIFSARLDRYDGDKGQSALDTPWGRLSLLTMQMFSDNPAVCADQIYAQWEQVENMPGARAVISASTALLQGLFYPCGQHGNKHSRPPLLSWVPDLVAGNSRIDRLSAWTKLEADRRFEAALIGGDPIILKILQNQERQSRQQAQMLEHLSHLVRPDPQWQRGLDVLRQLTPFFASYHRLCYHWLVHRQHPEIVDSKALKGYLDNFLAAIDHMEAWSLDNKLSISGKPYPERNCKSAVSFAEIRADAIRCVEGVVEGAVEDESA